MMAYKVLRECLRVKIKPHKVAGIFMITKHRVSVKGGVWAEVRVYLFDSLFFYKNAVLGLGLTLTLTLILTLTLKKHPLKTHPGPEPDPAFYRHPCASPPAHNITTSN